MPDEIEINEAPESEPEGDTTITVAPVIVEASESEPDAVSRAEFDAHVAENAAEHAQFAEVIGRLATIEAFLVEDVIEEEQVVEAPAEETVIETPAEPEASTSSERHAGIWV